MSAVRTLPIRVAPLPGEAIDSWLEAIAHRMQTAFDDLLKAVALQLPNNTVNRWVIQLAAAEAAAIGTVTGVAPSVVHAMTLSYFANRAVGVDPATGRCLRGFPWGRARGSRYCPHCLAETGGRWQLSWRLGFSFACIQHQSLLADICPGCGGAQRHRTHVGAVIPRPGHCANPVTGPTGAPLRCGADLTAAAVTGLSHSHPALTAQRIVYDVIDTGAAGFGIYRTHPSPSPPVLTDIRAVAGRILKYATADEFEHVVPPDLLTAYRAVQAQPNPRFGRPHAEQRPGLTAPAHAATTAVGVTAALTILSAPTIASAGEAMRWLVTSARNRGLSVNATTIAGSRRTTQVLAAVQLTALAPLLNPGDQLRYRIGTSLPRRPDTDSSRVERVAERIPTMLWPEWSLRLAIPGCFQRQMRPALSIALLLVGTRVRLRDAADLLDSPIPGQSVPHVLRKLYQCSRWEHVREGLIRLGDYLHTTDTPINYRRRRHLDYSGLLPAAEWTRICRDTGTPGGSAARAKSVRYYLVERLTGTPVKASQPTRGRIEALRKAAEFPRHLTPELSNALLDHARNFLATQGITDEPVTWHPSTDLVHGLDLPGRDPASVDIPALHQLIRQKRHRLAAAAERLNVTLDDVRHSLERHPAPAATQPPPRRSGPTPFAYRTAKLALPRETLVELYHGERNSLRDIGASIGVSRQTITRLARDYGIELRELGRSTTYDIDGDWLYEQYVDKRRSLEDIAAESGMSVANMARWARVHNIPVRRLSRYTPQDLQADDRIPSILRPALAGIGGWERLQRFADAANYPTLQIAAHQLGLNQFALVDQINRIERDLGGRVLIRAKSGQPMRLTPVGSHVIAAVRSVAELLEPGHIRETDTADHAEISCK